MKKTLSVLLTIIMALCCMPLTAYAGTPMTMISTYFGDDGKIDKPQKPYIKFTADPIHWDTAELWYDTNADLEKFITDMRNDSQGLWEQYNLADSTELHVQVDCKVDGDSWQYDKESAAWDACDGYSYNRDNYLMFYHDYYHYAPGYFNAKTNSHSILDTSSYNPDWDTTTDPKNYFLKGCINYTQTDEYDHASNLDIVNHTYTFRYRFVLYVEDTDDSSINSFCYSPWSEEVSIGKNATQQTLVKPTMPAAITINEAKVKGNPNASEPRNEFSLDISIPRAIYDDLKYFAIYENETMPVILQAQYRINGGKWVDASLANAWFVDEGERYIGTLSTPLKAGDAVEFRIRATEGVVNKDILGAWSNTAAVKAVVTDYNYVEPVRPVQPVIIEEPAISSLSGGASQNQVTKFITGLKNDNDAKGSKFGFLLARQKKVTKNAITITWQKPKGAAYYVIYGAKCGKKYNYQYITSVKTNSFTQKKLKKGTYYKYIVSAFDKNGKLLGSSNTMHITTSGGKWCNFKAVKTAAKKDKVTLAKKGKTFKLKGSAVKENSKKKTDIHRPVRYESSNKKIATVDSKGKITAKKKGSCTIYVFAQNGAYKKIKVTVKK